jgi:hypothetical protein
MASTPHSSFLLTSEVQAMSVHVFAHRAREHWAKWLPKKVAALKEAGELEATIQAVARRAQRELLHLMQNGYRAHEAEEVVLHQFILLKPEADAELLDWEREELDALEQEFRRLNK